MRGRWRTLYHSLCGLSVDMLKSQPELPFHSKDYGYSFLHFSVACSQRNKTVNVSTMKELWLLLLSVCTPGFSHPPPPCKHSAFLQKTASSVRTGYAAKYTGRHQRSTHACHHHHIHALRRHLQLRSGGNWSILSFPLHSLHGYLSTVVQSKEQDADC